MLEGAIQFSGFAGPALAGVLIGTIGATNVLWIDSASYVASFLLIALFVRPTARSSVVEEDRGTLAGLRFIARDRLMRSVAGVSFLFGVLMPLLFVALPVMAYTRFDGRSQAAGWLFAAWGAGSVAGSVLAYRAASRIAPLRLARVATLLCVLPLWLLPVTLPLGAAAASVFACAVFVPAINVPVLGLFTLRTPTHLRGKVMAALYTTNSVARPASFALSGPLLHLAGLAGTFIVLAGGLSAAALIFVGATRQAYVSTI